jgi:hypothetical protein
MRQSGREPDLDAVELASFVKPLPNGRKNQSDRWGKKTCRDWRNRNESWNQYGSEIFQLYQPTQTTQNKQVPCRERGLKNLLVSQNSDLNRRNTCFLQGLGAFTCGAACRHYIIYQQDFTSDDLRVFLGTKRTFQIGSACGCGLSNL